MSQSDHIHPHRTPRNPVANPSNELNTTRVRFLHHFTSRNALNRILLDDEIIPHRIPGVGLHGVWCTTGSEKSNVFSGGFFSTTTDPADKGAVRFTLRVPVVDTQLYQRDDIVGTASHEREEWFIVPRAIPRHEWFSIFDVYTGFAYLNPAHAEMVYIPPPPISTEFEQMQAAAAQKEWMQDTRNKFADIIDMSEDE
jgi:hypothetical protein